MHGRRRRDSPSGELPVAGDVEPPVTAPVVASMTQHAAMRGNAMTIGLLVVDA
jgi:hypothetical protein